MVGIGGETHRLPESADGIVGPLDTAGGEGLEVTDGPDGDASTEREQSRGNTELCAHDGDRREPAGPGAAKPGADGVQQRMQIRNTFDDRVLVLEFESDEDDCSGVAWRGIKIAKFCLRAIRGFCWWTNDGSKYAVVSKKDAVHCLSVKAWRVRLSLKPPTLPPKNGK